MQMLVTARHLYSEIYKSVIGLVFFGTPFRGNGTFLQQHLIQLAHELDKDAYERQLDTSQTENPYLESLFSTFQQLLSDSIKPRIACFYEQKKTNISVVVDKEVGY